MTVKVFGLCVVSVCLLNSNVYGLSILREADYETTEYEEPTTSVSPKEREHQEKLYVISVEKLPWHEARLACLNDGLRLASPLNPYENEKLLEYIREYGLIPVDKFAGYWIGGFRIGAEEPWLWESKTKTGDFGWLPGEPNYYIGEDCVELKNDGGTLGWNNYYCQEKKRYICEKLLDVSPPNQASYNGSLYIKETEEDQTTAPKEKPLKDDVRSEGLLVEEDAGPIRDNLPPDDEIGYIKKEEEENYTDQEPEVETSDNPIKHIKELGEENHDFSILTYNEKLDKENEIDNDGLLRK